MKKTLVLTLLVCALAFANNAQAATSSAKSIGKDVWNAVVTDVKTTAVSIADDEKQIAIEEIKAQRKARLDKIKSDIKAQKAKITEIKNSTSYTANQKIAKIKECKAQIEKLQAYQKSSIKAFNEQLKAVAEK